MRRIPFFSIVSAALTALLVLGTAPAYLTTAQTATADHEQHHPGTPEASAATDPCVAAALPPTAGMPQAGMMTGTPPMGAGRAGPMGQFDLMFIDMMIPHHASAVAMAQAALTRAEHPELRALAETIIESQSAEIEQMQIWREQWFPGSAAMPMDQMGGMMGGMMGEMMGEMMGGEGEMGQMMGQMMGEMMGEMMPSGMMPGAMVGTPGAMPGAAGRGRGPMIGMEQEIARLCTTTEDFDLAFVDAMIPHHRMAVIMATMATMRAEHPELRALAQTMVDDQQREVEQMQAWRAVWSGEATPAN
jgi:uncharacterized protein (DUF305 family)